MFNRQLKGTRKHARDYLVSGEAEEWQDEEGTGKK